MSVRQFCKYNGPSITIFPGNYTFELVRRSSERSQGTGLFSAISDDDEEGHLGEVNPTACDLLIQGDTFATKVQIVNIRISSQGLCLVCIEA